MKSKTPLILLFIILALLAFTNPNIEQFRGHIKEREGLAGTLGLLAADVLSATDPKAKQGIHRDNYILFSRFYLGGDGFLPREDLAWGALGKFWWER